MRRMFTPSEIRAFLVALDKNVSEPVTVELIGSAAAMLAFGMDKDSKDVDLTKISTDSFAQAWTKTQQETGLEIPAEIVGIYDAPYYYESRREILETPELRRIHILVPERHDWALMKVMRLSDKDMEHVVDVAHRYGFDADIFLERFQKEMTHVMGDKGNLKWMFLSLMGTLFGPEVRARMRASIDADPNWKYPPE